MVLLVLVAAAVVVAVLAVATGRWPVDPLSDPTRSTPDHGLPEEPLATDVDDIRFDTAARGYDMEGVDARLDTLRVALAERERRLAELERARSQPESDASGTRPMDTDPTVADSAAPEGA